MEQAVVVIRKLWSESIISRQPWVIRPIQLSDRPESEVGKTKRGTYRPRNGADRVHSSVSADHPPKAYITTGSLIR